VNDDNVIIWKARFERKEGKDHVYIQVVLGKCVKAECSGELSTSEVVVAYIEEGKSFVRLPQELWKTGVPLSCSACEVSFLSPFEIVEALTFQAEATVKIKRGFQMFRSFNIN